MILTNFGLWWSGGKLSYLRYLTFKTLRYFHPHSRIQLFTSSKFKSLNNTETGVPMQEYINDGGIKDYTSELKKINVEIVKSTLLSNYLPFQQADIFRWNFLKHHGGIYLDPDQIILQSFKTLPLDKYNFMYSSYAVNSIYAPHGWFSPIGVLGSSKGHKVADAVLSNIFSYSRGNVYNAIGVSMFEDMLKKVDTSDAFNAPSEYFYPVPICEFMDSVYDGSMVLTPNNYALHWYGGYEKSMQFNINYTEEFARTSNDTISKFLREHKII